MSDRVTRGVTYLEEGSFRNLADLLEGVERVEVKTRRCEGLALGKAARGSDPIVELSQQYSLRSR